MRYGEKRKTVFLKIIRYTHFTSKVRVVQKLNMRSLNIINFDSRL